MIVSLTTLARYYQQGHCHDFNNRIIILSIEHNKTSRTAVTPDRHLTDSADVELFDNLINFDNLALSDVKIAVVYKN